MNSIPAVCSGMSLSRMTFSPVGSVTLRNEPLSPIFSMPPCANTDLVSILKNLYLIDDEPQFRTSTFILYLFLMVSILSL